MGDINRAASPGVDAIEVELRFLDPASGPPVTYTYDPPPGTPRRSGTYVSHMVAIRNGRTLSRETSLDREAFLFMRHASQVSNFYDETAIKRIYYPEVAALVRERTGATSVLVFDHTVRVTGPAQSGDVEVHEPITVMHNDYTKKSGTQRVRDLLPAERAARVLHHRVAQFNVWRPVRGPLQTKPLAVCDAASMRPEDYVPGERRYPDRIGEFYAIAYSPRQRWYYFPAMQPDEVLLIKCYDSDPSRAQFGGHGAFADPNTPANALPRESIETRTFAFFGPD